MAARSSKVSLALVSVVLIAVAAYWYWSPLIALSQMRTAMKASDAATFNEHVDFPKLRESMKTSLTAQIDKASAQAGTAQSAAAGMLGKLALDRYVEGLIRPETVMQFMKMTQAKQQPAEEQAGEKNNSMNWIAEREGVNIYIAWVGEGADPKEQRMGLVMERSGFAHWRLVDLRMPSGAL